ncbi:glutamate--cysteine ligase [Tersicoccus solisilvae]|nr:glutamate--cysteine ligase [Tersicoccus solisilvae]
MGDDVSSATYSRQQRTRYRRRLMESLETFDRYLSGATFQDTGSIGLEVELNLVDATSRPSLRNASVLDRIADPAFQTEIGAYNIEMNYPVTMIAGRGLADMEAGLRARLNHAEERAAEARAGIVMVGILPTITEQLLTDPDWMSPETRYEALNLSILAARGEDVQLDIQGEDDLQLYTESVSPEAACTSVQLHVQVSPSGFASAWNASQVLAGPQVALAANSPHFLGRRLWHETRVVLFHQAIDSRPPEMRAQGVRPRVWFGERWITSIFDLFEENVRWFPALLPELREDRKLPPDVPGRPPRLHELRLHNGTVYRWNRPIYDPGVDEAHLRVENRLLPAGPTVADIVANAAFYYGVVHVMRHSDRPLWSRMAFSTARENFEQCAKYGLDAQVYWPGVGDVPVDELIVRQLLPMAETGLHQLGVDPDLVAHYLGILRDRAKSGQNGARWQLDTSAALQAGGMDRDEAMRELVRRYRKHMHANLPVHEWPAP